MEVAERKADGSGSKEALQMAEREAKIAAVEDALGNNRKLGKKACQTVERGVANEGSMHTHPSAERHLVGTSY